MLSKLIFLVTIFCATRALEIKGFANWQQDDRIHSNDEQDALMLEACTNAYSDSNSVATHDELIEMEIENTSGRWLAGACGGSTSCNGKAFDHLLDGLARNAWSDGKITLSTNFHDHLWVNPMSALCVFRSSLTELPTVTPAPSVSPTIPTSKPTAAPTKAPTELSTFRQTFLPTAYPTEETGNCPDTVDRLEIVIEYLLDYVFCLKHEKEKEKCNGSFYKN